MPKVTIKATEEIQALARKAWDAKNACSSCGLSFDFRACLMVLLREHGTDYINQHPITVLWIDRFALLARCENIISKRMMEAYAAVGRLMDGLDVDWEVID